MAMLCYATEGGKVDTTCSGAADVDIDIARY